MIYFVQGHLGSGKSLASVWQLKNYAEKGRRIATNFDIDMSHLLSKWNKVSPVVIPTIPTYDDLKCLGKGGDSEREAGLLVLDECALWLNSRKWNDPGRDLLIQWLVHSRKFRWDVIILVQSITVLDKQVRELLQEYVVTCSAMARIPIPLIGRWLGLMMPKFHIGSVTYGPNNFACPRWVFRGNEKYFNAYDTEAEFDLEAIPDGTVSQLSHWHQVGRYEVKKPILKIALIALGKLVAILIGIIIRRNPAQLLVDLGVCRLKQSVPALPVQIASRQT